MTGEHVEIPEGKLELVRPDGRVFHIPAKWADWFYDGRTGQPITDEQWDESMRRAREADPDFRIE